MIPITVAAIKMRESRTLLVGWLVQASAAHNFINANKARVPLKEQDEWRAEVWENAKSGIVFQLFRTDDYCHFTRFLTLRSLSHPRGSSRVSGATQAGTAGGLLGNGGSTCRTKTGA